MNNSIIVCTENLLDGLSEEMLDKVSSNFHKLPPLVLATEQYAKKIQDRLMQYSHFDAEQGCFIRTKITRGARKLGPIGCINNDGYKQISVEGFGFYQSHLVHLWFTGCFPENGKLVDHIDGNRINDRPKNLRVISRALNNKNRGIAYNNTSGYAGVSWRRNSGKWLAVIRPDGEYIHLGLFDTLEEAVYVRKSWIKSHPERGFTYRHGTPLI